MSFNYFCNTSFLMLLSNRQGSHLLRTVPAIVLLILQADFESTAKLLFFALSSPFPGFLFNLSPPNSFLLRVVYSKSGDIPTLRKNLIFGEIIVFIRRLAIFNGHWHIFSSGTVGPSGP